MTKRDAFELDLGRKLLLVVAGAMAVAGPVVFGLIREPQSTAGSQVKIAPAKLPAFEVASIKPDKSGSGMMMLRYTPVGLSARNVPLRMLIQSTYGVEDKQIVGAPGWVGSERYDIEAKVSSSDTDAFHNLSPGQRDLMLQPLLADRFQLKVHTEVRDLPVLALVVAKDGPKLHEAKPGDTYPNGLKGPDGYGRAGMMRVEPGQLTAQGLPISDLTGLLSAQLGQLVRDESGLTGKYDFTLNWTPDERGGPGGLRPDDAAPDSSGPSLFTAIHEQLGLKLESRKAPVEVLVIDHIERASEN